MSNNAKSITLFEKRVHDFAYAHHLFRSDKKYVVALSGGADSVSLLLVMKALGFNIEAAHCNFNLRGEESNRDEKFCISLCVEQGIPLHRIHFDTREYAALHKKSLEMAARDLRYAYFANLMKDIGAEAVCVAHHRDDSVETVLINLIRGTGISGLKGILPKNNNIVRPLLCVGRENILDYLSAKHQPYVTDSTNLIDDVMRNKIRLDVLPLLEKINPSVKKSIFETSLRVGDALKIYDSAMADSVKAVMPNDDVIDIACLMQQVSPESVLFSILKEHGFSSAQVTQLFSMLGHSNTGRIIKSASHEILIDRGRILIESIEKKRVKHIRIPEKGVYIYDNDSVFEVKESDIHDDFQVLKDAKFAYLDSQRVTMPLIVRPTMPADRFVPFGMKQSKLVSDYLTDRKRSLFDKRRQLVVTDAEGRIVWLVGERIDNRFRITSSSSVALILSLRV